MWELKQQGSERSLEGSTLVLKDVESKASHAEVGDAHLSSDDEFALVDVLLKLLLDDRQVLAEDSLFDLINRLAPFFSSCCSVQYNGCERLKHI